MDYRPHPQRREYCDALYKLNLDHGIMPGLVYLYMPHLKHHYNWSEEQALWFAFLNGMTQNPLTSLLLMEQLPMVPEHQREVDKFGQWFSDNREKIPFDTDRRHQKKDTAQSIATYAHLVADHGSQVEMLNRSYPDLWDLVSKQYYSFGRLSTFSYLEYVRIMGHGDQCTDLMFNDRSGSKSHRNGMLFLQGKEHLVDDRRAQNGFNGRYENFQGMCEWLTARANDYLREFSKANDCPHIGYFTFESQLCQFKHNFFGRRYPGVYVDMGFDRLLKHERLWGRTGHTKVIRDIRQTLPKWMLLEEGNDGLTERQRASFFPKTGFPYRGKHFL
jgi:hypothetical protein